MRNRPRTLLTLARAAAGLSTCVLLAGCSGSPGTEASTASGAGTSAVPEEALTTAAASPSVSASALHGKTIAVDPGHNGRNGAHPREVNRKVPDGRGGKKACNTTGTATAGDYSEHAFNFDVGTRLRTLLTDAGAKVVMSRDSDDGVGPCVDERGQFAGKAKADVLVSIHANGTENTSAHGFHVIMVKDAVHDGVEKPSRALAEQTVKGLSAAGFKPNAAYGKDGIIARTDIAGLSHAEVPAVLVECGEMRNPDEAAVMESADGRQRYAEAIAAGLSSYFAGS